MYKLVYTKRAVKDVKKFDKSTKKRIGETLDKYKDDPFRYSQKLTDQALGSYRFRIGDYRVVFDIVENEIVVLRIGH